MPRDTTRKAKQPELKPTSIAALGGKRTVDGDRLPNEKAPKAHRPEHPPPAAAAAPAAADEDDVSSEFDEEEESSYMSSSGSAAGEAGAADLGSEEEEESYEGDDEEDDDSDAFFGFEEEGEEREDSTDYSDDSSQKSNIAVNFDAREMYTRHIDGVSGLIDSSIPDGENIVDRHELGVALKAAYCTTLITVTQIEEDDASDVSVNTADPMDDEDIYGMLSFMHVGSLAAKFPACGGILTVLGRTPETHVVADGTSPVRLLKGAESRALLLLNDHLNIVPPRVTVQVLQGIWEELTALTKQVALLKTIQHVVFLARIQRSKQRPQQGAKGAAAQAAPAAAAAGSLLELANYDFLRWEDEVFLKFRDPRLTVPVFKFPRYVENQAEADIPRCVVFGVPMSKIPEAIAAVAATAQKL